MAIKKTINATPKGSTDNLGVNEYIKQLDTIQKEHAKIAAELKGFNEQYESTVNLVSAMDDIYDSVIVKIDNAKYSQSEMVSLLEEVRKNLEINLKHRTEEQDLMSGLSTIQSEINEKINIANSLASQFRKEGKSMFAGKTLQPIVSSLENIANRFGKAGEARQKILENQIKNLRNEGKVVEAAMLEFQETAGGFVFMNAGAIFDTIYQKIKSLVVPVLNALVDAAKKGIDAILKIPGAMFEVMKATTVFSKIMIEKLGSMTQSIIAIPLNILEKAQELGYEIKKEMNEFAQTFENLQKDFVGGDFIGKGFKKLQGNLIGARKEFMNVNTEAVHLFGRGIAGINKAFQETQTIVKSLGVFTSLFADQITKNKENAFFYFKMKQIYDLTDEDLQFIARSASNTGKSIATVFQGISDGITEAAHIHHQDAKQMSRDYLDMRKNVISFGHITNKELGNVVARTRQMRVEMKDAVALFERVQTFEDAANMSSQLSQSFNMVVDSMELLRAESPDQMLKMLRDAMFATGRSFNEMNRFEKSLLQQQTGLSSEAMQALFSFENAGKSYQEIMDDMNAKDPVQQQIKSINQMKDAIVELKETMPKFQNAFDAFFTGLKDNVLLSSKVRKELSDVSFSFDSIYLAGLNKNIKNLEPAIMSVLSIVKSINALFSSRAFLASINSVAEAIANIIKMFADSRLSLGGIAVGSVTNELKKIKTAIQPIFSYLYKIGISLVKGAFDLFVQELPDLIKFLLDSLDEIFKKNPATGQSFAENIVMSFKSGITKIISDIKASMPTIIAAFTNILQFSKELFLLGADIATTIVQGIISDLSVSASSKILTSLQKTFKDIISELFTKTNAGGINISIFARIFDPTNIGNLITSFKNIMTTIIPIMEDIVLQVTNYASKLIEEIAKSLSNYANTVDFTSSTGPFNQQKWVNIANNLSKILDKLFLDTSNSIVASLFKLADKFFDYLGNINDQSGKGLIGLFKKVVDAVSTYYLNFYIISIKEILKNFWPQILVGIGLITTGIYASMKGLSSIVMTAITTGAQVHAKQIENAIIRAAYKMGMIIEDSIKDQLQKDNVIPKHDKNGKVITAGSPQDTANKKWSKGQKVLRGGAGLAGLGLLAFDYLSSVDDNDTLSNTLMGAAQGAALGGVAGLPGAAIGGILGAASGYYGSMQDGFISKDGKVVKIHDNDNVIAFKENGPIMNSNSKSSTNSSNQSSMIKPEDLKAAVRDAIIEGFKSQSQTIEVKLNGEKVGEGLLASGFVNMMTNANKTKGAPTINPNTVIYRDGQIPSSGYNA